MSCDSMQDQTFVDTFRHGGARQTMRTLTNTSLCLAQGDSMRFASVTTALTRGICLPGPNGHAGQRHRRHTAMSGEPADATEEFTS